MTDIFAKNWLQMIKNDPIMNAVFKTEHWLRYNTRVYEGDEDAGFAETDPRQETVGVEKRDTGENRANIAQTFEDENRAGVLRHGDITKFTKHEQDYFDYTAPSFFSLRQISSLNNPLIDILKHK